MNRYSKAKKISLRLATKRFLEINNRTPVLGLFPDQHINSFVDLEGPCRMFNDVMMESTIPPKMKKPLSGCKFKIGDKVRITEAAYPDHFDSYFESCYKPHLMEDIIKVIKDDGYKLEFYAGVFFDHELELVEGASNE